MRADTSQTPEPAVRVLGRVELAGPDGAARTPRGARAAALVAVLALADGAPVAVPALVDELWPGDAPADPRAALHNLVSRLRQGTGPEIVRSVPAGYALGCVSDLSQARRALAAGRAELAEGRPDEAGRLAGEALRLWRGEPGEDLEDGAVAMELRGAAARLHDELVVLSREAAEAAGDHATVAALASEALAADPLDEDAARSLMGALAAQGKGPEAVRVFARLRHALVVELGADPAPDLVALHDRLLAATGAAPTPAAEGGTGTGRPASGFALSHPGGATSVAAAQPAARRVALGLRAAPNALLGRDGDVVAVEEALRVSRLVTVLGAGGLGKTRLAQEVARRAAATTTLVVVVELAGVRSDDDVVIALADALGLGTGQSTRLSERLLAGDVHDQVLARLRGTRSLVVLDNCEHLVAGAAHWASELLASVPGLHILATSRAPLRVAAEQTFPLAPLVSDGAGPHVGPAVELFRQRARAARPDVRLPDDVVARLCERLDGLPLAIELAAARVRSLSVEEIEEHLDARFALLRSGDAAAPDRHRTLEAVIEWSWNLLTDSQQAMWRRVCVLPDGFGTDAAAAIGQLGEGSLLDVLDDLDGLVTQSLLSVTDDAGVARYRMLETVREFGLMRLDTSGEREVVRDALLDWAGSLARREVSALLGPGQPDAVAVLMRDQENLLFAFRVAAERVGARARRPDVVVWVMVGLGGSWALRGSEERGAGFAGTVLDAMTGWRVPPEDADVTVVALIMSVGGQMMTRSGGMLRALARIRRALRELPLSERTRAIASVVLLPDRAAMGDTMKALRDHRDPLLAFAAALTAGQEAENDGRLAEAERLAEASYDQALRIGDVATPALAAVFVASAASERGDFATAAVWNERARGRLEQLGSGGALRQLDWMAMTAALSHGDLDLAERLCDAMERVGDDPADRSGVEMRAATMAGRGEIALARGDVERGLERYRATIDSFEDGPGPTAPWAVMLGAARLVRLVQADRRSEADEAMRWLSRRVTQLYREWMPEFLDRPVLGTACVGAAARLLTWGDTWGDTAGDTATDTATDTAATGWELLALAEALGSREDVVAVRRAPVIEAAVAAHGAAALDAARAHVAALAHADVAERALTLLERIPGEGERA